MQVASYRGRHADLYDIFYAEKAYQDEAAAVAKIFRDRGVSPSGRLLDLACGTGKHAVEFANLGYQVTGLDLSADMIRVAKSRTQDRPNVHLQVGDMRKLDFDSSSFDCASCLFDSIGYLLDNESILTALSEVFRALKSGGVLVAEFWHAPAMLRGYDAERTKRFRNGNSEILRTSKTSLNPILQTATVHYEISELDPSGAKVSGFEETQKNRFFQCQEFALLASVAGFKEVAFQDGFSDAPVGLDTWHVLAVMSKP